MMKDDEAYRNMQSEHLGMLTSYGRDYVSQVIAAAELLEDEFLGKSDLSLEEKQELFKILSDVANKHLKLIKWSIDERQNFSDANG